jgi:hypothetical protein
MASTERASIAIREFGAAFLRADGKGKAFCKCKAF